MQEKLKKCPINIDRTTLKLIAIISMLIDHIGAVLFPQVEVLRWFGRLAFPIFIYQLVEGFEKTSNLKKYFGRLFLFAIISEIPFDLCFFWKLFYFEYQNVYFELCLCLLTLTLMYKTKYNSTLWKFSVLFVMSLVAILIRSDYQAFGILLTVLFYVHKNNVAIQGIGMTAISLMFTNTTELFGLLSLPILELFNVKRLPSKRFPKLLQFVFYAFYPLHIILLYFIKILFF